MKKTYQRLTACISAMIICITSSALSVSAEEMISGGYIPEGLPAADGVTQVDDETAELLNRIHDELTENVYTLFSDNEDHDVRTNLLLEYAYVIYESSDQNELDAAKKYCDEHGIEERYVWLKYSGPVDTVVYTENEEEHSEHITDHAAIMKLLEDFIDEKGISSVYLADDAEYGKVIIELSYVYSDTEKALREFIASNKICYNETEVLIMESFTEPVTDETVYGDLNSDKTVDLSDLTLLSLMLLKDVDFNESQMQAADIMYDQQVDLSDLALLKQYVMNQDVKLGK